jgi:hypothetical protein
MELEVVKDRKISKSACRFTTDELRREIERAENDIIVGRITMQEEFEKEMELW